MLSKVFVALTLASATFANVFITTPFTTTSYVAGKEATVQWRDDSAAPTLAEFGPAKFSIYAGNARQQTLLQALNASVDVSKVSSITFVPDATIGPNGKEYFIRVESLSLKDATTPSIPALAFSARFTLTGMTGTFSAAVSSQIAGQSTAPLPGSSSTTTASTTSTKSASSTSSTSSTSSKATSATSGTPTASKSSSAIGARANTGLIGALLSALIGVTVL